jgi:hypothetical protein
MQGQCTILELPMDEDMAPSNAETLEKRTVTAPAALWQACECIAEHHGDRLAEVYRRVMASGVSSERDRLISDIEYENKVLINRRLKAKEHGAEEAVARLKAHSDLDVQANAELIEVWLRKG